MFSLLTNLLSGGDIIIQRKWTYTDRHGLTRTLLRAALPAHPDIAQLIGHVNTEIFHESVVEYLG